MDAILCCLDAISHSCRTVFDFDVNQQSTNETIGKENTAQNDQVEHISKQFGTNDVLKDINLEIP